jgi:beta-lactamase superfamily II metal-dependent hydrolase
MSRSSASTTTNTLTDSTHHGRQTEVIAPPPGELFSETNDDSVAILLSYDTARVFMAGDAEAKQ